MAVFKIKTLASALAILGAFAVGAIADGADAALSAQTVTEPPVTQEVASATSDGMILYTMSVCTVTHQTECSMVMSTGGQVPPAETNEPSVPADGEPTTVHKQDEPSLSEGYPKPSESGPDGGVPTGSQPGYSAPPGEGNVPSQPGEPVPVPLPSGESMPAPPGETVSAPSGETAPVPSVISTTDASGNPTVSTAYNEPSDAVSGTTEYDTASGTVTTGIYPSSTDENGEIVSTGTPTVTANGGAVLGNSFAALCGLVGVFAAILL
ncbi:hypothetical protein FDECE_3163 [Fusarium decemcellulare]|nr:hypothetical protein FDECE_3163 [Fusarium decemcellulare]